MNTRTIAAAAAVSLLAGLGTAATTATSQAQPAAYAAKATKFDVTATVSNAEPEQGDKITIRGTVSPAVKGAVVVLQKRYGTGEPWKKAATDTLNGKGKFSFKDDGRHGPVPPVPRRQGRRRHAPRPAGARSSASPSTAGATSPRWCR